MPLGIEMVNVEPANKMMHLFVSAVTPEFKTWRRRGEEGRTTIYGPDGLPVQEFPSRLTFRVTASTKQMRAFGVEPGLPIRSDQQLNEFLLKLQFKLRVFRGLDARTFEPANVELIGVPANVAYDERIWLVSYDVSDVLLTDRLFLDVLTPAGDRISKFYLGF